MATVFEFTGVRALILDILARRKYFEPKQLDDLEELIVKAGADASPELVLIKGGYITDQEIAKLYAEDLFLHLIPNHLVIGVIDKDLAALLPEKLCTDKLLCPLMVHDEVLDVAFVCPEELGVVDELELLTGLRINPMIAPFSVVQARLDALYRADKQTKAIGEDSEKFDVLEEEHEVEDENILNLDQAPTPDANGRIVRMVNQILDQALRNGASDIHLEPFEDGCKF